MTRTVLSRTGQPLRTGMQLKQVLQAMTMLGVMIGSVLEMYCCTVLCEKKEPRSSSRKGAAKESQRVRSEDGRELLLL